jgi:homoserine kinase type II
MAVFTSVSEADLSAWLSNYSLGTLLELEGIPEGIQNTNYFVTTGQGQYVLTLFEKLTPVELPFFLNLMAHLSQHGIPCPRPMADRNERLLGELNGKPACIVSRLSGKSVTQPTATQCASMGAMLGKMHVAGQSYGEEMLNPRGAAWRLESSEAVKKFLSAQDAALLQREVEFHAKNALVDIPRGVIHADLFKDNVLMDGDRVGGLIDFYFACTGSLLYDVAITVNDWCLGTDGKLDVVRTRALLTAYHTARPFVEREAALWPQALRLAALRFWISRLYDLHLPQDGELVIPRKPEHFKLILQNHIDSSQPIWL